jgi:hypothetical protein
MVISLGSPYRTYRALALQSAAMALITT